MFEIELLENEKIIVIDYNSKIYTKNKIIDALIILTNFRLLFYVDSNVETDYIEVLRLTRGVKTTPRWEKRLELMINEISNMDNFDGIYNITINDNLLRFMSPKILENNLLDNNFK